MCKETAMISQNIETTFKSVDSETISILRQICSEDRVSNDPIDLMTYSYDATKEEYPPQVVVWPENEIEISEILKLASEQQILVYPRGGGSGSSSQSRNPCG